MSEQPHTTDLGTRYRYRREGAEAERERIIKLLEQTVDQEKKLLNFNPNRTDFKQRHNKISIANQFIGLIKGETE